MIVGLKTLSWAEKSQIIAAYVREMRRAPIEQEKRRLRRARHRRAAKAAKRFARVR